MSSPPNVVPPPPMSPPPPPLKPQYLSLNIFFSQCTSLSMFSPLNVFPSQCSLLSMFSPLNVLSSQCLLLIMYSSLNIFHSQCLNIFFSSYHSSQRPLFSISFAFNVISSQSIFLNILPSQCPPLSMSSSLNVFPS